MFNLQKSTPIEKKTLAEELQDQIEALSLRVATLEMKLETKVKTPTIKTQSQTRVIGHPTFRKVIDVARHLKQLGYADMANITRSVDFDKKLVLLAKERSHKYVKCMPRYKLMYDTAFGGDWKIEVEN